MNLRLYKPIPFDIIAGGILLASLLSGCSASLYRDHPEVSFDPDTATAAVYFIRPAPVKTKGIADNPIEVSYKGKKLMKIPEGTYTMVKIKPGSGEVTTHSRTRFINKNRYDAIDVTRSRKYTFVAGRTYFIHLKRIDEEFRGIFYDPQPVDLMTAKQLADQLHVSGPADEAPIAQLEIVPDIPKPGELEPAYPEDLYPGSPYKLKKPVVE
jgi:hypothetical protein